MANRNWASDLRTLERGLIQLNGWVELADDASVASTRLHGMSISKTGTGAYTLVPADGFVGFVSGGLSRAWNGSTGNILNVVFNGLPSAQDANPVPSLVINTMSAVATAADTTSTMGFYVDLLLKNSAVV